jgi:hypothetical protein
MNQYEVIYSPATSNDVCSLVVWAYNPECAAAALRRSYGSAVLLEVRPA